MSTHNNIPTNGNNIPTNGNTTPSKKGAQQSSIEVGYVVKAIKDLKRAHELHRAIAENTQAGASAIFMSSYYNDQDENSIKEREDFTNSMSENFLTTQSRISSYARNSEISDDTFNEFKDNAIQTYRNILKKRFNTLNHLQQSHLTIQLFIDDVFRRLRELEDSSREKLRAQQTK